MRLELHRVPEGGASYEVAATMVIDRDGQYVLDDPQELVPTDLPVLIPDREAGGLRRVFLEDDPDTWGRNLHTVLRTGYLVPVVVDTEPEETPA